ncbi:hypothetical protein F7725_014408 [Dissostichus mawsoni]|uniref:F-box/LRR-repeat protein 15 n=1 Tax=Dissostichus mawsoni TaxID=36200 RepID=A0A7J5YW74_DISMA|nr:hypothetical protein F7725_014408 [Dissostichus mawsoni]
MDEEAQMQTCHLLDLPWEDVLVPHILCFLPLQHLVSLQRVSMQFHSLIQVYLTNCRTFDLSSDNKVLHSLCLSSCSEWVTDKELLPVIGQNQHLQRVDMSCVGLTRHSLVAVSLSCMHLQHLGLAHCEWVDSLSLRSLADHCGGLQSINITACRQLKDDAICYMAKKCLKLRSLSLAVNANVTDESVEEVAKNCRGLEQLDLTGCLRVRNQSIRTLAEYCPKLLSLKVNHCHNVTESSLDPLRKRNVVIDVEPPLQRALCFFRMCWGLLPLSISRYRQRAIYPSNTGVFIKAAALSCITCARELF